MDEEVLINCETLESTKPNNVEYESYDPIELQSGTNVFTSTFSEGYVTLRNWEIY